MDLQLTFECILFFKKSKMRFEHYLLHFRPFWTSKSDLKIAQKSIKNWHGNKHWILQSFELHFFTSKWEHHEKRSKKGSQKVVEKWCQNSPGDPFDPRRTPDGPQKLHSGPADPKMTSKRLQNDPKTTSECIIFGLKIRAESHVIVLCCVKKWREFCLGKEDFPQEMTSQHRMAEKHASKKLARVLSRQRRSIRRKTTAQYKITAKPP